MIEVEAKELEAAKKKELVELVKEFLKGVEGLGNSFSWMFKNKFPISNLKKTANQSLPLVHIKSLTLTSGGSRVR